MTRTRTQCGDGGVHSIYQILHVMSDMHNDMLLSDAMLVNLVHVHTYKHCYAGLQWSANGAEKYELTAWYLL